MCDSYLLDFCQPKADKDQKQVATRKLAQSNEIRFSNLLNDSNYELILRHKELHFDVIQESYSKLPVHKRDGSIEFSLSKSAPREIKAFVMKIDKNDSFPLSDQFHQVFNGSFDLIKGPNSN